MAPEQARGEPADARVDLFAAGAIAYELATGRRAFDGATHADRLSAVLRDEPPFDGIGPLAPILARCLAKDPRDRFHAAADLAWALDAACCWLDRDAIVLRSSTTPLQLTTVDPATDATAPTSRSTPTATSSPACS